MSARVRGIALTPAARRPAADRFGRRTLLRRWLVVAGLSLAGCAGRLPFRSPPPPPASNPFHLAGTSLEATWETAVDVLRSYGFRIGEERRLEGYIATEPMVGSGCLEPWFSDSIGSGNRLESTLQSIRRRVFVTVRPHETGGFLVGVEAIKEKEDVAGQVANSPGNAALQEYRPGQVDLNDVVGQTGPSGWYVLGRDLALEQHLLGSLQQALTGG